MGLLLPTSPLQQKVRSAFPPPRGEGSGSRVGGRQQALRPWPPPPDPYRGHPPHKGEGAATPCQLLFAPSAMWSNTSNPSPPRWSKTPPAALPTGRRPRLCSLRSKAPFGRASARRGRTKSAPCSTVWTENSSHRAPRARRRAVGSTCCRPGGISIPSTTAPCRRPPPGNSAASRRRTS